MTTKLGSLSRWNKLEKGAVIWFDGPSNRDQRRRIRFNLPTRVNFYYQTAESDGDGVFLACLEPGIQELEFYAPGKVGVVAGTSGDVFYQCAEDEPTFVKLADPVSFTKIMQRRDRNPEVERMFAAMVRNQRQREAALEASFTRRLEAVEKAAKPAPALKPKKGKIDGTNPPEADGNDGGNGKASGKAGDGGKAPEKDDES